MDSLFVHASSVEAKNASSNAQVRYLEVLKHQETLNDNNKNATDEFRSCKTLNKIKPMYLEVKQNEAKVN